MTIVFSDPRFVASVYLVRIFTLFLHNGYNIISLSLKLIKPQHCLLCMIVWLLDLQLAIQSVPITIKVVSAWRGVLDTTLFDNICK